MESPNVQVQGRCAALSRSVPWNAVLARNVRDVVTSSEQVLGNDELLYLARSVKDTKGSDMSV